MTERLFVREYEDEDLPYVKNLLLELQEFIICVDPEKLNILTEGFSDLYAQRLIYIVRDNRGKIYVAEENNQIVGMIAGIIEAHTEDDRLTYRCPVEGRIIELYVDEKYRNRSIGSLLMESMEQYFHQCCCEYVRINVLSNNTKALSFYQSHNYIPRTEELMKKL